MKKQQEAKRKNRLVVMALAAYLATVVYDTTQGSQLTLEALKLTGSYLLEMLQVMPAVLILTALITTWVPRKIISANLGVHSGLRGKLASIVIGSVSAGPIYAAFPIAQTLMHKGASIGNVVIIISSWAVIKIPMLAVEARFLGARFTMLRYLWTVPSILLIGAISNRVIALADIPRAETDQSQPLQELLTQALPGFSCKACGFSSCSEYAQAVASGRAGTDACVPGGDRVAARLRSLMASSTNAS